MRNSLLPILTLFVVVDALQNGDVVGKCSTSGDISCYSGTKGFITCANDLIVYRDCDPATVCFEGPVGPYCSTSPCNIQISTDQIPVITEALPVYELRDRVVVDPDYLSSIIKNVASDAQLTAFGGSFAAFDGDKLVAFVHPDTGESRVFPTFECLKPGQGLIDKATAAATQLASDTSLFPTDDTQLVVRAPTTLSGSQSCGEGNATDPEEYLAFVSLQRQINGIPVYGPGTQATIAVDANGDIQAFSHRYRPAFATKQTITPNPPGQIVQSIMNDVSGTCSRVAVVIDNVVISYFDNGNNTIQPVYTYSGSVPSADNATAHSQIFGSISIGTAPNSTGAIMPIPQTDFPSNAPAGFYKRDSDDEENLNVGRYVVRADTFDWLNSATAFLTNLHLASSLGSSLSFIDKQYLAAVPDMFVSQRNDFINSVQIALNEVHGDWGKFTTYRNYGDIVTLAQIAAAGGLGPNAGGCLAYWILHSCEVLPTQTDESTSFDVWWEVFRGLHSVVGYRTDMLIDDGVTANFGLWIGLGAAVVPAWFLEVATIYGPNSATYFDTNRGITEPVGRPSSISVCGHRDDTASDVKGLGTPTCLIEMWLDN